MLLVCVREGMSVYYTLLYWLAQWLLNSYQVIKKHSKSTYGSDNII